MAICDYCRQEMTTARGCIDDPLPIENQLYAPVRWGSERSWQDPPVRCHDCGVLPGEVHHHGCDVEVCPRCGDQSISCDCRWDDEDERWDDEPTWGWFGNDDDDPFDDDSPGTGSALRLLPFK